jgi:DNA-binding Lrp family transcriptional regulator
MDRLDILILKILERKPRISTREIASFLGISPPSVQRRMSELERTGRIRGYFAYLHPQVLSGSVAIVHGVAEKPLSIRALDILKKQYTLRRVIYYSDGRIIATLFYRSTIDLNKVLGIMEEECHVINAEALLISEIGYTGPKLESILTSNPVSSKTLEIEPIDFAIIDSLKNEARKPALSVAKELGVSPRTIHKHMSSLIDTKKILLEVAFNPFSSNDIKFVLRICLSSRFRPKALLSQLKTASDYIDKYLSFDNSLRLVLVDGYATSIQDLSNIISSVAAIPGVKTVHANIMVNVFNFETWVERNVSERAKIFNKQF